MAVGKSWNRPTQVGAIQPWRYWEIIYRRPCSVPQTALLGTNPLIVSQFCSEFMTENLAPRQFMLYQLNDMYIFKLKMANPAISYGLHGCFQGSYQWSRVFRVIPCKCTYSTSSFDGFFPIRYRFLQCNVAMRKAHLLLEGKPCRYGVLNQVVDTLQIWTHPEQDHTSPPLTPSKLTNRDMKDMDCSREWPNLHVELRGIDLCTLNEDPAAALRLR